VGMRRLYHFPPSPFARRTRLSLAHKGLAVELIDARAEPALFEEATRLGPFKTVPILVEEDGSVLGDSTAISHYLDRAYPNAPRLWPNARDEALVAFEVAALVDVALETVVATGNRFHSLKDSRQWEPVRADQMRRAQAALDAIGARVAGLSRPTFLASGWSAVDIWAYSMCAWFEGLPERAKTQSIPAQIVSLGWKVPETLSRWAKQHAGRADIAAL
jgi:glutathione S-transferase